MKKIAHLLMGRLTIVGVSILLQICWLFLVLWKFSYQFTYANLIIRAAAIVLVLVIANKWENPANKLSWTFLILLSPILGIMLYFLFGRSGLTKHTREQMDAVNREVDACMPVDEEAVRLLQEADPSVLRQSKYIADWGHFPVYRNTATKYYESGGGDVPGYACSVGERGTLYFSGVFHHRGGTYVPPDRGYPGEKGQRGRGGTPDLR